MADTTYRPIQNGFETQLSQELDGDSGALTVYCIAVPTATIPSGKYVAVVLSPGTINQEIVKVKSIDTTNLTLTIATAGRAQALGNSLAGTANTHTVGSKVIISADYVTLDDYGDAIDSKVNLSGDTMTGLLDFSGTDHAGIQLISLTTAQRTALSGANGMIVYDTDLGMGFLYQGGAWGSIDTGTASPNGSTTVNGTWQGATVAEQGTATAIGSTGAGLLVQNQFLVKTSSGAGDENKLAVLDSSGKFASGFIPVVDDTSKISNSILTAKGSIIGASAASTPAEIVAGTVNQRLMYISTDANGLVPNDFMHASLETSSNASTGDATQDITVTCGFQPFLIRIAYTMQGLKGGGASSFVSQGEAVFEGTTLKYYQYQIEDQNASSPTTLTAANYGGVVTTTPASPGGVTSGDVTVTFAVQSVSATGFVLRVTYTRTGGGSGGGSASFGVIAIG